MILKKPFSKYEKILLIGAGICFIFAMLVFAYTAANFVSLEALVE